MGFASQGDDAWRRVRDFWNRSQRNQKNGELDKDDEKNFVLSFDGFFATIIAKKIEKNAAAKESKKRASVTSVSNGVVSETYGPDEVFQDIISCIVRKEVYEKLNIGGLWEAVEKNKTKIKDVQSVVNASIEDLLKGKLEEEQVKIIASICNYKSYIFQILMAKQKYSLGNPGFITSWGLQKSALEARIQASRFKLDSILSSIERVDVQRRHSLKGDNERYAELRSAEAPIHLVIMRQKYLLLNTFCTEEGQLFAESSKNILRKDQVSLITAHFRTLMRAMQEAADAFDKAYEEIYGKAKTTEPVGSESQSIASDSKAVVPGEQLRGRRQQLAAGALTSSSSAGFLWQPVNNLGAGRRHSDHTSDRPTVAGVNNGASQEGKIDELDKNYDSGLGLVMIP